MIETPRRGLMIAMNDVDPCYEDEFNRWHNEEHFPERMSCQGFLSGRRYRAIDGRPRYMAIYELESPDVLYSEAYLKIREPSAWTLRMREHRMNVSRGVYIDITPRIGKFDGRK